VDRGWVCAFSSVKDLPWTWARCFADRDCETLGAPKTPCPQFIHNYTQCRKMCQCPAAIRRCTLSVLLTSSSATAVFLARKLLSEVKHYLQNRVLAPWSKAHRKLTSRAPQDPFKQLWAQGEDKPFEYRLTGPKGWYAGRSEVLEAAAEGLWGI